MGLRFSVLSSGSTGNATVIEGHSGCILLDAGISAKKLELLLQERNVEIGNIHAILVTHEHADHIKGLGAIARKYELPIYANKKTWEELDRGIGEIAEAKRQVVATGETFEIGSMQIESYSISHDAADPVGYSFLENGEKLSVATDLGYMSSKVKEKIADSDVLVLESNHDIEMLRIGKYPWNIKRRILSDIGHLSNEAAAEGLADIWCKRTKRVYLAHLSRDHNFLELARMTVEQILLEKGITVGEQVKLMDTYHDRPTPWDTVKAID